MIDDIIQDAKSRMAKSVETLRHELTKLRTGRAHTSLLDHITVDSTAVRFRSSKWPTSMSKTRAH